MYARKTHGTAYSYFATVEKLGITLKRWELNFIAILLERDTL